MELAMTAMTISPNDAPVIADPRIPSLARACFGFVLSTTLIVMSMVAVAAV
jgi:hypothetical protein